MSNFPEDVIIGILRLLDAKPLLRFRSLSKRMCSEIDSPNFINAHLKKSMETRTHLKLILREKVVPRFVLPVEVYQIDFDDADRLHLQEAKEFHIKLKYEILDSCNGLLLLHGVFDRRISTALWNPFTRRCKILPDCEFDDDEEDNKVRIFHRQLILGYDSANDDYKVVMIWKSFEVQKVRIYSLKSNSWSKLPDLDLPWTTFSTSRAFDGCFFNGDFYVATPKKGHNRNYFRIAVLDQPFESSSYNLVELPVSGYIQRLMVLDDHLFVSYRLRGSKQVFSFLGRKDGESIVWSELCTFDGNQFMGGVKGSNRFKALAYSKKKDKVLIEILGAGLIWYDLQQKKGEAEFLGARWSYRTTVCWESLVSLGDDTESDSIICYQVQDAGNLFEGKLLEYDEPSKLMRTILASLNW